MNEVDELQALKSTVARLEAEVTRMKSPTSGNASLAHARRGQRWALWLGAAGLCSLPVLGWAAVSLTEFQPDTPIVASDVNTNFSNLNAAVDGPLVFGNQAIEPTSVDGSNAEGEIANAVVDVATAGGRVRVELVPLAGEAQAYVGVDCVANQECTGDYYLDRSGDGGGTWTRRGWVRIRGVSLAQAVTGPVLPPSLISFVDDPPAGEWRYRITVENTSQTLATGVGNAWLTARELGGG